MRRLNSCYKDEELYEVIVDKDMIKKAKNLSLLRRKLAEFIEALKTNYIQPPYDLKPIKGAKTPIT